MKTKRFSCVEMQREGARRIYELTKNMTLEEELAFWHKKGEALEKRIRAAKRKHSRELASKRG
jgi:hypothetical protein